MSKEFEVYVEEYRRLEEVYKNLERTLKELKAEVKRIVPGAQIFLFGSVVRGKRVHGSDIDVLIVVNQMGNLDVDGVKAALRRRFLEIPLEIHITDSLTMEKWYRRFIPQDELIEVT
ncbi:MAG: nucleotidyltransferase domain-containing protein [Desulfurococcaceae archaeon]